MSSMVVISLYVIGPKSNLVVWKHAWLIVVGSTLDLRESTDLIAQDDASVNKKKLNIDTNASNLFFN